MNRTFFAILVLGSFALTKAGRLPICTNTIDCRLDYNLPDYNCFHGICIRRGEYKTKHSRLYCNCRSNLKTISKLKIQIFIVSIQTWKATNCIFILRKDIWVVGWSRKWQFPLTLFSWLCFLLGLIYIEIIKVRCL